MYFTSMQNPPSKKTRDPNSPPNLPHLPSQRRVWSRIVDEYSLNGPLVNANSIDTSQGLTSTLQQSSRFLLKSINFFGDFLAPSSFIRTSYRTLSPRKLCIQRGIIQVFDLQRSLFLPTVPHSRFTPPRTSKHWHLSERVISDAKDSSPGNCSFKHSSRICAIHPKLLISQNIILTTSSP